jgi:hypothetical protein
VWHGLEQGRLPLLALSLLLFSLGCGVAHLFWILTK